MSEKKTGSLPTILSLISCGWFLIPVVGVALRGSARGILFDCAVGITVSGALLVLMAIACGVVRRRKRTGIPITNGSPSLMRITLAGLVMLGFGIVGLVLER